MPGGISIRRAVYVVELWARHSAGGSIYPRAEAENIISLCVTG